MSQWTVKRPEPEQSPGARVGSYLFGVVLLAALGGLAGAFLPAVLATMGSSRRREGENWIQRNQRQRVARDAKEQLIHDTKSSMLGRVLIGALIGAAGGGVLAFKTEAARKKKLGSG